MYAGKECVDLIIPRCGRPGMCFALLGNKTEAQQYYHGPVNIIGPWILYYVSYIRHMVNAGQESLEDGVHKKSTWTR
jgi:hypothetical protein